MAGYENLGLSVHLAERKHLGPVQLEKKNRAKKVHFGSVQLERKIKDQAVVKISPLLKSSPTFEKKDTSTSPKL